MNGGTRDEIWEEVCDDVAAAVWLGGNVLGFMTLAWLLLTA